MVERKGAYSSRFDKLSFVALNLFWGLTNKLGDHTSFMLGSWSIHITKT